MGSVRGASDARDELIVKLRRSGWTHREIGVRVGLSARGGVSHALVRISAGRPGRPVR